MAAAAPFVVQGQQGSARSGVLTCASGTLATPNAFFYSKKGNPAHISLDLLPKLPQLQALQVPVGEFIHAPGAQAIRQHFPQGRLHQYVQLPGHILYMSARDPLADGQGSANDNGVLLQASQGATRINAAQYAALTAAYQPDIVASLSDEVSSTVGSTRARKSSQRSVMWVDDLQAALAKEGAATDKTLFFASVQGGADLQQRKTSCYQLGLRSTSAEKSGDASKRIDGFVIGGLGSGEDQAKREELLDTIVNALPASKPRVLSSSAFAGAPDEVVRAVARGVDLFEVAYPHQLTMLGQASVFQFDFDTPVAAAVAADALPVTKLHLRDPRYAHDNSAILAGCTCFTCANHTRAYLHHLLNVHEMLAQVLLDLHNLHHYGRFLETLRGKLAADAPPGAFDTFKNTFLQRFLPPVAVTGPLVTQPQYKHQVGRALLGPFAAVLHAAGEFVVRRALPKDDQQLASIIVSVLESFGCTGPGYASSDDEVHFMYRAYETHNLPALAEGAMEDVPPAAPAEPLPPVRSAYFVVAHADDDSVVVGGGGLGPLAGGPGDVAELRKFYFLPQARGLGLGKVVLDQCLHHARAHGFKRVYLETVPQLEAAVKLYKSNGFVECEPQGNTGHSANCTVRLIKDI